MKKGKKNTLLMTTGLALSLIPLTAFNGGDNISSMVIKEDSKITNSYLKVSMKTLPELESKELSDSEFNRIMKLKDEELAKQKALAEKKRLEEVKSKSITSDKAVVQVSTNVAYEDTFNVSFYTSEYASTGKNKGHSAYGITASGTKATVGRTVACPKNIKFGTKISIEGIGERVCEDRGGRIVSGHLDVYVATEKEAYALGRKHLKVKVYKNEEGK